MERGRRFNAAAAAFICCGCCTNVDAFPISDVSVSNLDDVFTGNNNGVIWDELDDGGGGGDNASNTANGTCSMEVKLASVTTNGWLGTTNHKVHMSGALWAAGTQTTSLYQGTTLIASSTSNISGAFSFNLTNGEYASISDFTDLRIRFVGDANLGANTSALYGCRYEEVCP